jgi:hypothetical protein
VSRHRKRKIHEQTVRAEEIRREEQNRAAQLGIDPDQPTAGSPEPRVEDTPEIRKTAEARAQRLGMTADELLVHDREALRNSAYPGPNCLDPSEFNDASFVARAHHLLKCPVCAAQIIVQKEVNEDRNNPLVLDFKPSAAWMRKVITVLNRFGIDAPATANIERARAKSGANLTKHIASAAYIARQSGTERFVIIENGMFSKTFQEQQNLAASLLIPSVVEIDREAIHTWLVEDFLTWMKEHGDDLAINHHVLKRLVVEGTSVIGYVKLRPLQTPLPHHC